MYCEKCDKQVEYTVSEKQKITEKIDNIEIEVIGKKATCTECNSEVFPEEVFEYNRPILHAEYLKKAKELLNKLNSAENKKIALDT